MNRLVVPGLASGPVLALDEPISFWGGVDPATGRIVDAFHPQRGECVSGCVLVLPGTRGSCTGSGVLLELALTGRAPAALVFRDAEDVATTGALVAAELFGLALPVVRLEPGAFAQVARADDLRIEGATLTADGEAIPLRAGGADALELSPQDRAMLDGAEGPAPAFAMRVLVALAAVQGAPRLIPITRAHIDGCIHAAPAFLRFAEAMVAMGAKVRVPTTTNAISVDREGWRAQGVAEAVGAPAARLADAYVEMGARPSFTCAPYLLEDAPAEGEAVAWGESNAVIYANSVLGARTAKLPDFMDLCAAVTGRVPLAGMYAEAARAPQMTVAVDWPEGAEDAIWPLLGWLIGRAAPDRVPLVTGLEAADRSPDDLKALCAAFGTTSAAPMLRLASGAEERPGPVVRIDRDSLRAGWDRLAAGPEAVDLVAIGSPHASLAEMRRLADLLDGARCAIDCLVTVGRDVARVASREGVMPRLLQAGVRVVPDLCWCSISEPVFPPAAREVLTNSGKYAHYGPGLHGRRVRLAPLDACAEAACTGRAPTARPPWL
ncbi:aconitase X [Jannaschia seohaensis]|uniref:Aconitase subunit 1 n=1 Tax=Jannaschia seohaensis TaxID=475081 RepID=A0A2Y9C8I6_9RHOB|nr:aconitase X [Jannaschia seohaensis]PWJ16200.1 hypothetical protein BCF38_10985 [Jannaschia seohaensis]SSA49223.1 hypothetical protein SAMN05421539_10985 [Jannaschia seohaensis]